MEEMGQERRRFPRIKVELLVRYKVLDNLEKQIQAQTKDISEGGVCLVTREQFKPGTVLALEIKFPYLTQVILVKGRVVWSAESRLGPSPAGHPRFDNGVEFDKVIELDREQITDYLKSEEEKTQAKGWKIGIMRDTDNK